MKKKIIILLIIVTTAAVIGGIIYINLLFNKVSRVQLPESDEELGINVTENNSDNKNKLRNELKKIMKEEDMLYKEEKIEKNSDNEEDKLYEEEETEENSDTEINKEFTEDIEVHQQNNDVKNILFLGLDRRNPNQSCRSDCIMIVSIDRTNKKIKITSLMRDMYVPIPGHDKNRVNAAYAFGKALLTIKTINTNFGLDIRDFVIVDFQSFKKVIDEIGGVDIYVSEAEAKILNKYINKHNSDGYEKEGVRTLNGRQTVAYSRIRYVGNADYERTERQRRILNEVYKKVKSQNALEIMDTVSTILPYVETSLSNKEIIELAKEVIKYDTDEIVQYRLPVNGTYRSRTIKGMAVLVPDIEANKNKLYEFIYK